MRVSIIIPTFNRLSVLKRALDSVLNQTASQTVPGTTVPGTVGIEVVVVDDGSTDETREMIAALYPTIQYLYQPNQGPAAARNTGIRNAGGAYIAFLDSDDEWQPGKLKAQLKFFEEHPDDLICQTEEVWIRDGKRVNPMLKHKKYGGWIFEKCLPLCIVSPSAVMMRREFFGRVGLFDESFPACEDYDLWLRASAQLPIGLIEKPYVTKYGGHPDQRSREFPVMDRFRIRAIRKILDAGTLSEEQKKAARAELTKKCGIVAAGARKRGKNTEAEEYELVISENLH